MLFSTSRFGQIEVPDDKILDFPNGVIGFEKENKFVILKHKPESSFFWLQSLSNPDLAFSLLFPFDYVPDYKPTVSKELLKQLNIEDISQIEFYCMVVIPKDVSKITINLLSPVAVSAQTNKGFQLVLNESTYEVNHLLSPQKSESKQSEEKAS